MQHWYIKYCWKYSLKTYNDPQENLFLANRGKKHRGSLRPIPSNFVWTASQAFLVN